MSEQGGSLPYRGDHIEIVNPLENKRRRIDAWKRYGKAQLLADGTYKIPKGWPEQWTNPSRAGRNGAVFNG